MKYSIFFSIVTILLVHSSFAFKSEVEFLNRLRMTAEFKLKSRTFLNKLYHSANGNGVRTLRAEQGKTDHLTKRQPFKGHPHSSNPKNKQVNYFQYEYKDYSNISASLKDLADKFPNLVKLSTAQELYNLPNPGGACTEEGGICQHFIVHLTNHTKENTNKPQIYISGSVHGDERVGPTATLELIKLMVENSSDPWIKYLLDTRLIVLTPMTNPNGYFKNVREELLTKSENSAVFTRKNYEKYHKDINRDFPYLVEPDNCMETIGARVVNELYLSHLFSLALSLHGGTESLTYPFGVPNHIVGNNNIIPMNYIKKGQKYIAKKLAMSDYMTSRYRKGEFDGVSGQSTPPPDQIALKRIAETASDHTTSHKAHHYKTGDMSGQVYPVRGGMEDWAYSGSWEGDPIINTCKPQTYNEYPEERTIYSSPNRVDALKSIMFLLEVSNEKNPDQKFLGRKNPGCLLRLRRNAFFNNNIPPKEKKRCLDPLIDGYIPRVLRLSLTLIDLLEPYVNVKVDREGDLVKIEWLVGGAIQVDKTFVLYDYINDPINFRLKFDQIKQNSRLKKQLRFRTKEKSGRAVWDEQFSRKDSFREEINTKDNKKSKFLVFAVLAQVDKNWSAKHNVDPPINPQSHIVNLRNNPKYNAKNNGYILNGQKYFRSELKIIKLK